MHGRYRKVHLICNKIPENHKKMKLDYKKKLGIFGKKFDKYIFPYMRTPWNMVYRNFLRLITVRNIFSIFKI